MTEPTWEDALNRAVDHLTDGATERFATYGPGDARGATFWDAARWIDEHLRPELEHQETDPECRHRTIGDDSKCIDCGRQFVSIPVPPETAEQLREAFGYNLPRFKITNPDRFNQP